MKKSKKRKASHSEAARLIALRNNNRISSLELIGWGILALAVIAALTVSWRKWPDPIVDFGKELYLPWQITQGAVIYRDVEVFYGPLSQYFNALVFTLLGAGIMHIVAVNLVLYLGILSLVYYILRSGWGQGAAFVGSMFFVTVFSFNQFVGIGNYTFAAPYAHETTHGYLIILLLVVTWAAWLRLPRIPLAGLAGLLWGLCLLLKIEFIFTASLVSLGAILLAWPLFFREMNKIRPAAQVGTFIMAAICPSAIATIALFCTGRFSFGDALYYANSGATSLITYSGIVTDPAQASFLGFTNFGANLMILALFGSISLSSFALIAWICGRICSSRPNLLWPACFGISALSLFVSSRIPWLEIAKSFPVWLLATAVMIWCRIPSAQPAETRSIRFLLLLASSGLIARMAFNPRIYHCGYYQASLAGIIAVTAAWKMIPDYFNLTRSARTAYLLPLSIFLAVGVWQLQTFSIGIYSKKNQPLGTGADQTFGFDASVEPSTALLEGVRKTLAAAPEFQSLLVIPEGVTLNYLLRKKTPSYVYTFLPFWLRSPDRILAEINTSPPDYVLIISRDLREHGVLRFGDSPEHGSQLLSWIDWNCSQVQQVGGDPLDVTQRGAILFHRNPTKQ